MATLSIHGRDTTPQLALIKQIANIFRAKTGETGSSIMERSSETHYGANFRFDDGNSITLHVNDGDTASITFGVENHPNSPGFRNVAINQLHVILVQISAFIDFPEVGKYGKARREGGELPQSLNTPTFREFEEGLNHSINSQYMTNAVDLKTLCRAVSNLAARYGLPMILGLEPDDRAPQ